MFVFVGVALSTDDIVGWLGCFVGVCRVCVCSLARVYILENMHNVPCSPKYIIVFGPDLYTVGVRIYSGYPCIPWAT